MKKVLLGIFMLFTLITVDASVSGNVNNIKIENIKVDVKESIGYNEELKVSYSINPRDAKNLKLDWKIEGLKKGITVDFVNGKTTNESDGIITLKVNNTLDKNVVLTLKALQNNKVISTTKLDVETKKTTIERVNKELETLINNLDENLNKENIEENKEDIEKIEELLKNNSEVKLNDELQSKYEKSKENITNYKEDNKAFVIGVSAGLVVVFSGLLYWIFKKEEK